ncbi:MAG: hypothetical protein Q7T82_07110 [Armatimonadota bacterium]|nr:hypothetical protein [Armatimonadota bacterium]
MKRGFAVNTALLLLFVLGYGVASAQNLLRNPGFEDPAGWSAHWTIRDANGGNLTYHYRITAQGGGHGDARPRTGANAVEIYSSDRQTHLTQKVTLEPGAYRLSAWARLNNTPDYSPIELALGDETVVLPLASERYTPLWAHFEIGEAGEYEAGFLSRSYGVAFDDISLEKITAASDASSPVLHIDLFPSSRDRAVGIQYCLKGAPQWVNFAVTCLAPSKLDRPVMRILASDPVRLSGLNESVINGYRMRQEEEVKPRRENVTRDGRRYHGYSFALPRFVSGADHPLWFGGCWISDAPPRNAKLIMEIVQGESTLAREVISLVPVDPPKRARTPKRFFTVPYCVQNWQMAKDERVKALPAQFQMMGMNVWSDYGLSPEKPPNGLTAEEEVVLAAYNRGVRRFWPNFSEFISVSGGGAYSAASEELAGKDMYVVRRDGTVVKELYNLNYAANRGRAWMESTMVAWTRSQRRPVEKGLPFRYSGFINDGLEGMPYSYDASTLAAFAAYKGVAPTEVTLGKLDGEWKRDWILFNMDLYTGVIDVWTAEMRRADPNVKIVNTADTYGPAGFQELTAAERMKWARSLDYNMPQWYAANYYGSAYLDQLKQGEAEKVFGRSNGGTDVIPLLYLSMGGRLENPQALRFKILDMCSAGNSVKGIGYYIGTYAFVDAKFMVGLSHAHTLLADVEDYYADGVREDSLVKLSPALSPAGLIPGMDMEGNQAMIKPQLATTARVHRLKKGAGIALITVLTHSEQGLGEKVTLRIDRKRLPNQGRGLVLIDRLTGRRSPLVDTISVDTAKSTNAAVFEIAAKT